MCFRMMNNMNMPGMGMPNMGGMMRPVGFVKFAPKLERKS